MRLFPIALLPLLLVPSNALAADPPIAPGLLNGLTILDTFKDEAKHFHGDPDWFIDAQKPMRVRLTGVGKCKVKIMLLDKDGNDVIESDTATVTLPTNYKVDFALPNFNAPHNGAYHIRSVRVTPVSSADAVCVGQTFTTKINVTGPSAFSILSGLKPAKTRPMRIAFDDKEDNNTLNFRIDAQLQGLHPPCPLTATISGLEGFKRTFKIPGANLDDKLTSYPNVDKELAGIKTGKYVMALVGSDNGTCRGATMGPLEVTVVKPGLKAVTSKLPHYEAGKPQQALVVESSFPADKNIKCDLEVKLFTRKTDGVAGPLVQTINIANAAMPFTLTNTILKGDGTQFMTLLPDTLTHVIAKASGNCEGEVSTDFGVMAAPKPGETVMTELPKVNGLKTVYPKNAKISYAVTPPPGYTAQSISCCQVETYRLDDKNAWVKFKTLTGAATLSDLRTDYVTDNKPTLVRLRGYRNGVFTYWSAPIVIEWL